MIRKLLLASAAALALAAVSIIAPNAPFAPAQLAQAATPNVAVGAGQVMVLPFHFSGAYSATATSVGRFQMPQPCDLLGVGANARAISGTTNSVDVKLAGVSVLSAPITITTATTWIEGTITTTAIPDEGVVTIDITIAATSLTDVTLVLTCARK